MLLIGLAGGAPSVREMIANCLHSKGQQQLVVWTVNGRYCSAGRVKTLARSLAGLAEGRQDVAGLIYTHVLMEEEAQAIRDRGGVIWQVTGNPSAAVVMRKGDQLVTHLAGGDRHYLDPLEALSVLLLAKAKAA